MSKLIHAGVRRYVKNPVYWLGLLVSVGAGCYEGYNVYRWGYFDDMSLLIMFFAYATLVSLSIGREFSDGIFRTKVTVGHTKGSIFWSEMILALGAGLVMFLLCALSVTAFNTKLLDVLPMDIVVKIFLGFLLLNVAQVSIHVFVSTMISNKAIAVIVNLALVFGLYFAAYEMDNALWQDPYFYETEYDSETGELIETESKIENPHYVGGVMRDVFAIAVDIIPNGQAMDYYVVLYNRTEDVNDPDSLADEKIIVNYQPFYSIGLITVLSVIGYAVFRKKELK